MQLFPQPHKVFACCRKTYVITLGWLPRNNSPRSETYGSDNWYISLCVTAQLLSLGAGGSVLCKLSSFSQVRAVLLSLHSAPSLNAVKSAPFISPDNGFSKGKAYNCLSHRHISFRYIVHCTCTFQHQLDFQWRQLCSRESQCSIWDSGNHCRNLMVGTERFWTSKVWLLLWAQKLFQLL